MNLISREWVCDLPVMYCKYCTRLAPLDRPCNALYKVTRYLAEPFQNDKVIESIKFNTSIWNLIFNKNFCIWKERGDNFRNLNEHIVLTTWFNLEENNNIGLENTCFIIKLKAIAATHIQLLHPEMEISTNPIHCNNLI